MDTQIKDDTIMTFSLNNKRKVLDYSPKDYYNNNPNKLFKKTIIPKISSEYTKFIRERYSSIKKDFPNHSPFDILNIANFEWRVENAYKEEHISYS